MNIGLALPADWPAMESLLAECGLPVAGLQDHLDAALVAWNGERLVGMAALERYGPDGLLRSVAVAASHRGQGLGRRLVGAALDLAHRQGVRRLYLLTTTAPAFFAALGFRSVVREEVPAGVRTSLEFTTLCPLSAAVMMLNVNTKRET